MKTIALEAIVADTILGFCENLAELGMPKDAKDSDMWFRYLSPEDQLKVADKLLYIMERDEKRFKEDNTNCPKHSSRKIKGKITKMGKK